MITLATHLSDNQLVEAIRQVGAQRGLFETTLYHRYAYLIELGRRQHRLSHDECFSAYSDTILSVINQVVEGCFGGRSSLKTYLYRIFANKCVDWVRSTARHRSCLQPLGTLDDSAEAVADPARTVVEQLSALDEIDQAQARLSRLSPKSQQLILAWGEGYSDKEIARQLGYRSADVAKTSRLRILAQVRKWSQPHG